MSRTVCNNPVVLSSYYGGKRLHLGVTGSVACYKTLEMMRAWQKMDLAITVTPTKAACEFVRPMLFEALGADHVYGELFRNGDVFDHLEPGQMADCMAIIPASADFLAKMACGLADDMLSSQYAAFDGPVLVAPAMNTRMWNHAATRRNMGILRGRGVGVTEPATGKLSCGDTGSGRLAATDQIFLDALRCLTPKDMAGLKVMVTLGPTREAWDAVRFWSNPSSGRMGAALATDAWLRGADVWVIRGPCEDIFLPRQIKITGVVSAAQMHAAASQIWNEMDVGIFCAAVADYAPTPYEPGKILKVEKSGLGDTFQLTFKKNVDILASLSANRTNNQKILGFAAQIASSVQEAGKCARKKLIAKNADLMAGNLVNPDNGAFGADQAEMAVVDKSGMSEIWQPKSKADIARELLTWLLKL